MIKVFEYNSPKMIEQYRDLIAEEEKVIEKKKMIIESLKKSLAQEVENLIIPYSEEMLETAWKQSLSMNEDKDMYKFVSEDLMERLGIDGTEVTKIMPIFSYVYGCHTVYNIRFTYNGINFELAVPNVRMAASDNLREMNYGKYVLLYEKDDNIWHTIVTSYELKDIAKEISNFCNNVWE